MDVINYINLITSNTFADWLRCHNDIFFSSTYDEQFIVEKGDDNSINIICHILKTLYNEKIPSINRYYLMISIEEHLMFFIKTESGAIYMVQSLITDIKNRLSGKWDPFYMCQLLTLTCSISVHYSLPLSSISQSQSLTEGIISLLMDIITNDNNTPNWAGLKHTSLCSLLHLETCYPTILVRKKAQFAELVMNEKSIYFELLLQIYSLIFRNDVLNKCRQQQDNARLATVEVSLSNSEVYNKHEISKFLSWILKHDLEEKLIDCQSQIFKSLLNMIMEATSNLTPLGINTVARNCLVTASYLSQQNSSLWNCFISRFIRSSDINILEILMLLKISSKNGIFSKSLLPDETLQETLFSIVNNSLVTLSKRLVAAHWLTVYPFSKQPASSCIELETSDSRSSLLEPELTKSINLRYFDGIELKYSKLILMSKVMKTSNQSDSNSALLFSSLTELIKNVTYYEPGSYSNILFRVMFAMHTNHSDSVLIGDFENIFDNLVIKYPSILQFVVTYLNALNQLNPDESHAPFSARCLSQIAKLSNERLTSNVTELDLNSVKMHIHVLNCAIKMSQLDLKSYLEVLIGLIATFKIDLTIRWLDEACILILELCFNIIKNFGSSHYYRELTLILNEIRGELLNPLMEVKANFLYALIVSLSSRKVKTLIGQKTFAAIKEDDFALLYSALVDVNAEEPSLMLTVIGKSFTTELSRYSYDGDISGYLDFIAAKQFPVVFMSKLKPTASSGFGDEFVYGIEVEFETSSPGTSVSPWYIQFIQSSEDNSCFFENHLSILLSKAESFTISGKLSSTKIDGMFSFCTIESGSIELFDLGLKAPIEFDCDDQKLIFVENLIKNKLANNTFISIDFKSDANYGRFEEEFNNFLFTTTKECAIYLMFLAPVNHVAIKESALSSLCRRFDVFTDLNIDDLISIEDYLKRFE